VEVEVEVSLGLPSAVALRTRRSTRR